MNVRKRVTPSALGLKEGHAKGKISNSASIMAQVIRECTLWSLRSQLVAIFMITIC